MEDLLRHCIRKHGFKAVQVALTRLAIEYQQFYEKELAFLKCLPTAELVAAEPTVATVEPEQQPPSLNVSTPTPPPTPESPPVEAPEVKVVQISERAAAKAEEAMDAKEFVLEPSAVEQPVVSKRKMKKVIHKNGRIIPVKAEPVTTDLEDDAPAVVVAASVVATPVPSSTPVNEFIEQPAVQTQRKTPAEIKKWQRAEEAARRAYMKKNKISRSSLMTVENMRKWLGEGQTYAWIAREQLGCKEEDVSKFAKENGLQRKKN